MLGPVALWEQEAVAPGVGHEWGHHVVGLAVLAAVLSELERCAVGAGRSPEGPPRSQSEGAGNLVLGADPRLVVASL